MARIRYLKPDFFKDEDVAKLPHSLRLFYAGLWCQADRVGRLEDRPKRLKIEIFPYEKFDTEKALKQLSEIKKSTNRSFILRYVSNGERYIQILSWSKHQKPHNTERDSEIPAPTKEQLNAYLTVKEPLDTIRNGDGEGNGEGEGAKAPSPTKDFIEQLKTNPAYKHINIDIELGKMNAWLLLSKNKGRKKTQRFILSWLNRVEIPIDIKLPPKKPIVKDMPQINEEERKKVSELVHKTTLNLSKKGE